MRIAERKIEEEIRLAHAPLVPHPLRMNLTPQQQTASKRVRLRGMTRHASQTDGPGLREEVEDGAIDEIITEMKTSAYRRPDAGVRTACSHIIYTQYFVVCCII